MSRAFKQIVLTIADGEQQIILEKDVQISESIVMTSLDGEDNNEFRTYLSPEAAEDLANELINLAKEVRNK